MFAGTTIKRLEREYEYKRNEANKLFLAEKKAIYDSNPKLSELDLEIKKNGIQAAKLSLSNNSEEKKIAKQTLEKKLYDLKTEKEKILNSLNFKLEPKYSCDKCKDNGYITTSNGSEMCSCMKQKLINEAYNSSNMYNLKNETFEKLDLSLFSDTPWKTFFITGLSLLHEIHLFL